MGSYLSHFMSFWSAAELNANIIIFLNLAGAMLLGFVVGYERSYHGRAAGMRTYGLVCMASAALVVIAGYPDFWYGGRAIAPVALDPTRIIQGNRYRYWLSRCRCDHEGRIHDQRFDDGCFGGRHLRSVFWSE
jgi:hypothetical protein